MPTMPTTSHLVIPAPNQGPETSYTSTIQKPKIGIEGWAAEPMRVHIPSYTSPAHIAVP